MGRAVKAPAAAALVCLAACGGGDAGLGPAAPDVISDVESPAELDTAPAVDVSYTSAVAVPDRFTPLGGVTTVLDLLANDLPGSVPPLLAVLAPPEHGTAEVTGAVVEYTPPPGFNGYDPFTYRLSDASGAASDAVVDVTVYSAEAAGALPPGGPQVIVHEPGLRASDVAVLVNDADSASVAVADYYMAARGVPSEHLVHLSFEPGAATLTPGEFASLEATALASVGDEVQAWVITWTTPYRVGCMSITSAFALGYDDSYCTAGGCSTTPIVATWMARSERPWSDLGVRPAMALAGETVDDVLALIDRGVASDRSAPVGAGGWLVRTTDEARSVRWPQMVAAVGDYGDAYDLDLVYVDNSAGPASDDTITDRDDVMFYFTGLVEVPGIQTNTYLPGALADHLTSFGGQLTDSPQMSALRWLEAGVTASYGSVVEPCNFTSKFPEVRVVLQGYRGGLTALQAYWRSVASPGEGVLIGEPLARPYGAPRLSWSGAELAVATSAVSPLSPWQLAAADAAEGPWDVLEGGILADGWGPTVVTVSEPDRAFYSLVPAP